MSNGRLAAALCIAVLAAPAGLFGITFWFEGEGAAIFTAYNDVQIPADTGTRFSLNSDLSADTVWFYRLRVGADLGRHSVSLLYAPLAVTSHGSFDEDVDFHGRSFLAGTQVDGRFGITSYRATYAYTFYDSPSLSLAGGFTGEIRDSSISLDGGGESERGALLFVPLLHLRLAWRFLPYLGLLIEGDGLASSEGRTEDFFGGLAWTAAPGLKLHAGYRILEGGSGGASAYNYSAFHYATVGLRVLIQPHDSVRR
jgi:hypothetical protein